MHDVNGVRPPEDRGVTVNGRAPPQPRRSALAGGTGSVGGLVGGLGSPPYDAASLTDQHLAAWQPYLWSPDAELNIWRDRIVSRVRDLVRNDGWANGTITRILDNAIGPMLRPISKPDHRLLKTATGIKGFDSEWAREFGQCVDAYWRSWADDLGRWCDVERNMNFTELMRVAFRHKLIDGDALCALPARYNRVSLGKARYAICIQLIDPDRLSNPQLRFDSMWMRGGVEINDDGAATGYWIRRAHQGDWFTAAKSLTWDLLPRETSWGRPLIVHDYDSDRASQHRGGVGIFGPVLQRFKMLVKYDVAELDSAVINAMLAAYLESPFDHTLIQEAISDGEHLNSYQEERRIFHDQNATMLGNSRIPTLFPGEKINSVISNRPSSHFKDYENAVLRNIATATGISAQQLTNDWSDVNYSSARAALLESWKTLTRRRGDFSFHFCSPIRTAWMEELMDSETGDDIPLPAGAPDFVEYRTAYARCRWMGPGRGWVDPVAEKQGAVLGMQAALSTLEDECAEQGLDFEEVLEQRKYEIGLFTEYGIPQPEWTGKALEDGANKPGAGKEESGGDLPAKPKKPTVGPSK